MSGAPDARSGRGDDRHGRGGRDRRGHGGELHGGDLHGHEHLGHVPDAASPAVYAARAGLLFDPPARSDDVEQALTRFLAALSSALSAAGCTLVGHIKGAVSGADGDLTFHLTGLGAAPAIAGGHAGTVSRAALTLNVIVFGVDEAALPALVHDAWAEGPGVAASWPD